MENIAHVFRYTVSRRGTEAAFRTKRDGRWQSLSWLEWQRRAERLAGVLVAAGVGPGQRVVVAFEPGEAWAISCVAIWLAGAAVLPVYTSSDSGVLRGLLEETKPTVLLAEAPDLLGSWEAQGLLNTFRRVLRVDPEVSMGSLPGADEAPGTGTAWPGLAVSGPNEEASVLCTSGTEGTPKAIRLSHGQMLLQRTAMAEALGLQPEDEQLFFLPTAHIFGHMALVCQIGVGFTTAFAECLVKVLDNAQEVNPTLIGGAPRFFEKVQQFICQRIQQEAAVKQQVFAWAEDVGRKVARRREQGKPVRPGLLAQHRFASRLALDKVKASFGSRLRVALSAGAPLDGTLAEWYAAVGIPLMNAYGLTEVCGASHATRPGANRFGSVGRPLAGIETKILPSGEICLRGPTVGTQPYVSPGPREGSSPEPMPNDGWFATGDRGFVDEEGYLFLVERKRERSSESSKQAMPEGLGP